MTPVFMSEDLIDTGYGRCVGSDESHLRVTLTQTGNRTQFVGIGFGLGDKLEVVSNKKSFRAVYTVDENTWQGQTSLQLKLRDIKA